MSMARFRRSARNSLLALLVAAPIFALQLDTGAEIPIRLKSKISTQSSKAGDPVDAVVIGGALMPQPVWTFHN